MDDKLLYKYFAGMTTEDEDRQIYAWLQEAEANRKEFFELKNILNAAGNCRRTKIPEDFSRFMEGVNVKIGMRESKNTDKHSWWRYVGIAAAVMILSGVALFMKKSFVGTYRIYENTEERICRVILEDSSKVWLKHGAILTIPRKFSDKRRIVTLNGDAFFDVEHDEKAPFMVKTEGGLEIKVLGTSFCVSTTFAGTNIILEKGSVCLKEVKNGTEEILTPGHEAKFDKQSGKLLIRDVNAYEIVMSEYDLVTLPNASIDEIVSEVEREYHVALDCMSKDTIKRYTFNYQRSNTLEEVLQIISFMTGADVQIIK